MDKCPIDTTTYTTIDTTIDTTTYTTIDTTGDTATTEDGRR